MNEMSKNQTIKLLHQWTDRPFSWCRRRLKASHWDLYGALVPNYAAACDALNQLSAGLNRFAQAAADAINSIDWAALAEAAKKAKEEGLI